MSPRPSIRASQMDRILRCPGSLTLCSIVTPIERDDGYEGVMLHHLIATRAIEELGAIPPDGGLPPPEVPKGYRLPAFSEWIVGWAIRLIQERIPPNWSLMVEVPFFTPFGRWDNTGHADIIGLSPDATEVIGLDWKTGRDPVEPAETNEQAADYLLHLKVAWPTVTKSTFIMGQPRVSEDPEDEDGPERITEVTMDGDVLERLIPTMDARVCSAIDRPMELELGRAQCRWCSASLQCEATKSKRDSMKITMTKEQLARVKATPDDATLADWVVAAKILGQPIKDARELAKDRITKTGGITASCGTVITQETSRGSYKITRPLELWETLAGLLSEKGRAMACRWSMTAIKEQFANEMGIPKTGIQPVTAEKVFDAQVRSHVEQNDKITFHFR